MSAVIELHDVTRTYGSPPVQALRGVSLQVDRGELVAIVGPSGSGKSTLLNILGSLDRPSSGTAVIGGVDIESLTDDELAALRAYQLGFVFQQFHLSAGRSAVDNVSDGLLYQGVDPQERLRRARAALESVGLGHRVENMPHQLSGGERQRVAIARAIVAEPTVLLADEPTGNLDSASGAGVVQLLRDLNAGGATVVVITHDADLAWQFPRSIRIVDGRIVSDEAHPRLGDEGGASMGSAS